MINVINSRKSELMTIYEGTTWIVDDKNNLIVYTVDDNTRYVFPFMRWSEVNNDSGMREMQTS
jgi:hypothetical protein